MSDASDEKALMTRITVSGKTSFVTDWVVDSGATSHISRDRDQFITFKHIKDTVKSGGSHHAILRIRTAKLRVIDCDGKLQTLLLKKTLYVPEFNFNLISVLKAGQVDNLKVDFDGNRCAIVHKSGGYALDVSAVERVGLYVIPTLDG